MVGAAISPLVFHAGRGIAGLIDAGGLSDGGVLGWLHKVAGESEFKRYFNRSILLAALIGLWPLMRLLKMKRRDFGLQRDPHWGRHLTLGFLLAAGLLFQLGLAYATADLFRARGSMDWSGAFRRAIITAAGVSLLEEVLFRGILTGLLLRTLNRWVVLVSVAVLFAVLHYLKPPEGFELADADIHLGSGFMLAGVILGQFSSLDSVLSDFGTLLLVGLLLGYARLRTGALWLPIGLHAGWVFGVVAYRGIFSAHSDLKAGYYLPWMGESLKTGVFPLVVLIMTGALLVWWLRRTLGAISSEDRR